MADNTLDFDLNAPAVPSLTLDPVEEEKAAPAPAEEAPAQQAQSGGFSPCERDSRLPGWRFFSRAGRIKPPTQRHTSAKGSPEQAGPPNKGGSSMEAKTMGSFLAALRKAAGMTQRELAERLHVSDRAVSKWETGVSQS